MTISELNTNMLNTIGVGDIITHDDYNFLVLVTELDRFKNEYNGVIIYPGNNREFADVIKHFSLFNYSKYVGRVTLYN